MARVYDETQWEHARDLVVGQGMTYAQAAERGGIDLSTLQKRAAREGWQEQRQRGIEEKAQYVSKVRQLKMAMLDEAIKSKDAQQVHAWQTVERAFPEHKYGQVDEAEKRGIVAVVVEQLVAYLGAADASLLNSVRPHLRLFAEHLVKADWRSAE